MDRWSFVDLATKAKELGISEGTLRARALSGEVLCFIYAAFLKASGDGDSWLPAYDPERFPIAEWVDHGTFIDYVFETATHADAPNYHVSGWVAVDPGFAAAVITRGEAGLDRASVAVVDSDGAIAAYLRLSVPRNEQWVPVDNGEYLDGGYIRYFPVTISAADLFMRASVDSDPKLLSSRKEQSYLGIIAAMRALLQDKDGGAFPSDAKVIDQLVQRFKAVDGVSERNLQIVFRDATIATRDLIPKPKE